MSTNNPSSSRTPPVRVYLIDDHELVLSSLVNLLNAYDWIEIVGSSSSGKTGLDEVLALKPDVCVLDVRLPDSDAAEIIATIKANAPATAVLCLSSFDSKYEISEMIRAGASGYLLKHVSADEFVNAIEQVSRGVTVLHPEIARKIIEVSRDGEERGLILKHLTEREIEVLRAIGLGLSNREISARLFLSEDTVKTHISRILSKLRVRNRVEAVAAAIRLGILEPEEIGTGRETGLSEE